MKAYESRNAVALRKRVKKVHSKAKFVGVLYLLGALALAALACLPIFKLGENDLWVVGFWSPFLKLMGEERDLLAVITAALYAFILLTCLINVFKMFGKLGWLTKRSTRYVNGYNRNMRAMDAMGKIFSGSFAAIVNFYLLIYVLQPTSSVTITTNAYIVLAVGLAVHFLAGLIGGKVSFFNVGGPSGNVEEEKRNCGLFAYFFRNLVQVIATAGIVYFFAKICTLNALVAGLLNKQNPLSGDLLKTVVPAALQALILIWLFVLVKHATGSTEFNRLGIEGAGMKNYRIFSFLTVLTAGGAFALAYLDTKLEGVAIDYLIIAGIALVAFLIDCICKSRPKDKEEELEENQPIYPPYPAYPQAPMQAPYPQPQAQNQPRPQQAPYQQPIYVPVYYPIPTYQGGMPGYNAPAYPVGAVPTAATPYAANGRPAPSPAPAHLKPMPSPAAQQAEGKNAVRKKRRAIKERDAQLKRQKASAKQSAKIAKKNAKAEQKVGKKEDKFAKMNASVATVAPAEVVAAPIAPQPVAPVQQVTPQTVQVSVIPMQQVAPVTTDFVEPEIKLNPKKVWNVRCPRCGKLLKVREVSPYHRCPVCDKVFKIRKFDAYVKKA